MNWNDHSNIDGLHAFLGGSKYHWLNYDEEKLSTTYRNMIAKERGTKLHEFAAMCINLRQKLPRSKRTLNSYVNDSINLSMKAEQPLFFSENCFGTADAISFKKDILTIHDLKTGVIPAHIEQLEIYAALFCLEYRVKPADIHINLKIYQNDEILYHDPQEDEIAPIMEKIVTFDKIIKNIQKEER